jgi:hypothetical protein
MKVTNTNEGFIGITALYTKLATIFATGQFTLKGIKDALLILSDGIDDFIEFLNEEIRKEEEKKLPSNGYIVVERTCVGGFKKGFVFPYELNPDIETQEYYRFRAIAQTGTYLLFRGDGKACSKYSEKGDIKFVTIPKNLINVDMKYSM